jgi:hypothetical protein
MELSLFHTTVPPPDAGDRAASLRSAGRINVRGEQRVALHEEYGMLRIEKEELLDQVKLTSATPRMPGLSSWEAAEVAKADLEWFETPHFHCPMALGPTESGAHRVEARN